MSHSNALAASFPFSTTVPNVAMVDLPDERLGAIASVIHPKSIVPAKISFVDVPGLVEKASQGEGLGNQFLSELRQVDVMCIVLRLFDDANIPHVYPTIDPLRDYDILRTELALSDLNIVARRIEKTRRRVHVHDKSALKEMEVLKELDRWLNTGQYAKNAPPSILEDLAKIEPLDLLTIKPMLIVANVGEEWAVNPNQALDNALVSIAQSLSTKYVTVCARLENELTAFESEEAQSFREALGMAHVSLSNVLIESYRVLDILTYYTFGELGLKAWAVPNGTTAPQAAGKVHSDLESQFVKAEVFRWNDLIRAGSVDTLKMEGLIRLEGKEYRISEGDILYFRAA